MDSDDITRQLGSVFGKSLCYSFEADILHRKLTAGKQGSSGATTTGKSKKASTTVNDLIRKPPKKKVEVTEEIELGFKPAKDEDRTYSIPHLEHKGVG